MSSLGGMLRAERQKSGSALADEINACIADGKLVSSAVTCQLLENAMQAAHDAHGSLHFLIDGFPRSQSNADAWDATVAQRSHSTTNIVCVLAIECPEETLI